MRPMARPTFLLIVLPLVGCAGSGNQPPAGDRDVPAAAVQQALETLASGDTLRWRDPSLGDAGTITPRRSFKVASGQFCREYEITYSAADGRSERWIQTACRVADAGWRPLDELG